VAASWFLFHCLDAGKVGRYERLERLERKDSGVLEFSVGRER
jgi:hypothetical protein